MSYFKNHWSHADSFNGEENEYIKSFLHNDYSIDFHTHSFYEINIVLAGFGQHFIEGMSCDAARGCVFVIPPGVRHSYENYGNLDVHHILVHRDFLDKYFSEFTKNAGFCLLFEIEPYLRAQYHENLFLTLSEDELSLVLFDLDFIEKCKSLVDAELYINAAAKKLLAYFCMLISSRFDSTPLHTEEKKELLSITDCLSFIHQNFEEKLTITTLSERCKMARATFVRHFTKICGMPPYKYILEYRLKMARKYMDDTDLNLTEIAALCGFYDAAHLRKCLKSEKK
ncbi:MAG: AraC family transcriptional regulator [Acutalibacteraceae bacterium]|jgi:AraC-like DNA-binding protein/quercetin dioxygenase-like cupin family protein|nr:AraC family transcriptional regulator [Acutalibacteraceae bacterium]